MKDNVPSSNLLDDLFVDSNGWISSHSSIVRSHHHDDDDDQRNDSSCAKEIHAAAAAADMKKKKKKEEEKNIHDRNDDDQDHNDDDTSIAIFSACQKLLTLLQLQVVTQRTCTTAKSGGPSCSKDNNNNDHDDGDDGDNNDNHHSLKCHYYFSSLRSGKSYKIPTWSHYYHRYDGSAAVGDTATGTCTRDGNVVEWDKDNANHDDDDDVDMDNLQDWMHLSFDISDLISSILVQIMRMNGINSGSKSRSNNNNNNSSERMMLTFNTISIFLPIVLSMIQHARKHDAEVGTTTTSGNGDGRKDGGAGKNAIKSKKSRKKKVYLFFKMARAYSIVTTGQFKVIKNDVQRLEKVIHGWMWKRNHWKHKQQHQQQHHHRHVLASSTIPRLLIDTVTQSSPLSSSCHEDLLYRQTILQFCKSNKELKYARKIDDAIIRPLIMDDHDSHRLYRNSVQILRNRLSQILSWRFEGSHLSVYGSCLSGLSLGHSSDVDLSLYIPEAEKLQEIKNTMDEKAFQKKMKKFVYAVYGCIQNENRRHHGHNHSNHRHDNHHHHHQEPVAVEFKDMQAVPFARVPVVKGRYQHAGNPFTKDGSIHFDICILNDIAVANSGLLREYSLLDVRVRMLMLSVKSWIKWKDIGNAAERTLSSYTWMVMVIFYLQCIGFVPNLQCRELMKKHGVVYNGAGDRSRMHNLNGLKTIYLHHDVVLAKGIWRQPKHLESTPVSALLLGFFVFYARYFSQETTAVSIRLGNMSMQKTVFSKSSNLWRMVIEDPFETYDCHIPHDLGTPMDEKGQNKVTKALQEAANTMEDMFGSCHEIVDCIGIFNIVEKLSSSSSSYTTKDMILEHHKQEVHQQQIQSKITMGGTSTVIGSITSRDKEKQTIHVNVHNETSTKSNDNNVRKHDGDDKKPYIHANLDGRMRRNALQKNGNGIAKKAPGHRQGTKKSQHSNNKGYSRSKDTTPYISNRKNTSRS